MSLRLCSLRDRRHSLDPQACGGSATRASPTCRAARHATCRAAALAPVAGDADLRLEQSHCATGLHPHLRSAGRTAGRDGSRSQLAARRHLGARASEGSPESGARSTNAHRQSHLCSMGCRRRWRDDHHRPQEAVARGLWRNVGAGDGGQRGFADRSRTYWTDLANRRVLPMSPDQGGHTAMPVFGVKPPSYQKSNEFATRDIVVLASEATADGSTAAATKRRTCVHRRCDGRELDELASWHSRRARPLSWTDGALDDVGRPAFRGKIPARQLLRPRRAFRRALQRGELQESAVRQAYGPRVLQRRCARLRHPRAVQPDGSGVLRSGSQCQTIPTAT